MSGKGKRGFALPIVLIFLVLSLGAWALLYQGTADVIRHQEARAHRDNRERYTSQVMAEALRLLETGTPNGHHYTCKAEVNTASGTRWYSVSFDRSTGTHWSVDARPMAEDDPSIPLMPESF